VIGEKLECPFHGWQFQRDGMCSHIPYCDNESIPSNAKAKSFNIIERNGSILMYFCLDGNNDNPNYEVPIVNEIENGDLVFHASLENHVEAHIQEIPENGSDSAHFEHLHTPFHWCFKIISHLFAHSWKSSVWTPCESPDNHLAKFKIDQEVNFLNDKLVPLSRMVVHVTQVGPSLVILNLEHAFFGDFIIIETVTPIAPLFQKVTHSIYGKNNLFSRFVAGKFLMIFSDMFERDILIWRNKTYKKNPILVKNDGNILGFRRWYKQFYPSQQNHKSFVDNVNFNKNNNDYNDVAVGEDTNVLHNSSVLCNSSSW